MRCGGWPLFRAVKASSILENRPDSLSNNLRSNWFEEKSRNSEFSKLVDRGVVASIGDKNDRKLARSRILPQPSDKIKTGQPREVRFTDDQVDGVARDLGQRIENARRSSNQILVAVEGSLQGPQEEPVAIDKQDVKRGALRSPRSGHRRPSDLSAMGSGSLH